MAITRYLGGGFNKDTITSQTEENSPTTGDFLIGYEATSDELRKFDVGNLPTAGGGEVNTSSNDGAGEGLAKTKVGFDLPFKSLTEGTSITLTGSTDEVEIAVDDDFVKNTGGDIMAPKLTISDSATTAPLNVTERSAAPSSPALHDVYLDDGTNTDSTAPGWRRYTGAAWEDLSSALVDDATPQLGGELDLNDNNISLANITTPPGIGSDHTAAGIIITATVDANATGIGAALHMAVDGHYEEADADGVTTAPCTALALEAGTGTKKILLFGMMRDDTWNWTTGPGESGLIFLSTTTGGLTQTAPSGTGDVVQVVGYALGADEMFFNPQLHVVEVA